LNPEHDILVIGMRPCGDWHGNRPWVGVYMHLQSEQPKQFNTMSVNIRPLADRVLVEPAAAEEKTASGIIIPDSAKEKPQRGTVVAVGPGKKDEPTTVKEGDTVLYGKYSGTELQFEGKDYMIMREADILAIL